MGNKVLKENNKINGWICEFCGHEFKLLNNFCGYLCCEVCESEEKIKEKQKQINWSDDEQNEMS